MRFVGRRAGAVAWKVEVAGGLGNGTRARSAVGAMSNLDGCTIVIGRDGRGHRRSL